MSYMDFNPYLYQERRQQMLREINSLRLNKRLRDDRGSSGSRFLGFVRRSALPLARQVTATGADARHSRWIGKPGGASSKRFPET